MPNIQKVTDPDRIVTDLALLSVLEKQGVDKDYVEFFQDYSPRTLGKEHSPYAKFYRDLLSNKRWMIASGLPMVKVEGHPIEAGWYYARNKYYSKANLFSAVVQGKEVLITCLSDQPDGRKLNDQLRYTPQLFLNGVERPCGKPSLLPIDPVNSSSCQCHSYRPTHYSENTLEWDYGVCKRRLRIIEGHILGSWVFNSNPNGEVRIKYNQSGNYKLRLGQFKVNNDEEVIPKDVFDNPANYFLLTGYPLILGDTATFYPDAHVEVSSVDGYVGLYVNVGTSWSGLRDAINGNNCQDNDPSYVGPATQLRSQPEANEYNDMYRGVMLFDTAGLPDSCYIPAATISLYGKEKGHELATSPTVNIVSSNPTSNTALVNADYSKLGTTLFCDTSITYTNFNTGTPGTSNDFILNAAGIAAIARGGVSKFGLREATYDAPNNDPLVGGQNYLRDWMYCWSTEKGVGYKPKLVVTYYITARHGFVNFQDPGIV